ncbi:MAG TPA: choice-of-anchor Q domain-containing protein [Verrucomicrobiae bacterium]|nr:choice-of-anchor Q domain-containing protein [Verrucomicrobiae bacterium]
MNCTNPVSPYTNWITAATSIQDAVDAAPPHALILVTNGVYTAGGRAMTGDLTNRVALNKPMLTLQSIGGPNVTIIQGQWDPVSTNGPGAVRCVGLAFSAILDGFTLRGGATRDTGDYDLCSGGGVWCADSNSIVTNCIIIKNAAAATGGGAYRGQFINCVIATNRAGDGGGNCGSVLNNCSLVGNWAYHAGGGMLDSVATNCVFFLNSAGEGGGASGALFNCTVISNTASIGGGVWSGTAVNCLISGNSAMDAGGGAYWSTLFNCTVTNNSAAYGGGIYSMYNHSYLTTAHNCLVISNAASSSGGGAYNANLNNCTVVGNSAQSSGGGVTGSISAHCNNCIIYYNTAPSGSNWSWVTYHVNCCTTPAQVGVGDITNEPSFVNPAACDFHLLSNSPCINSGNNAYVTTATDLEGDPRIVGGTVDIGAYECQSPALLAYYAWLQSYGLPTSTPEIYNDSDNDGMNNWKEWMAGTDPTSALSLLEMLSLASTNSPSGIVVTWQSVTNRTYILQRSGNLSAQWPFSTVQSNIAGKAGTTTYTDTSANDSGPYFYRVGVQ